MSRHTFADTNKITTTSPPPNQLEPKYHPDKISTHHYNEHKIILELFPIKNSIRALTQKTSGKTRRRISNKQPTKPLIIQPEIPTQYITPQHRITQITNEISLQRRTKPTTLIIIPQHVTRYALRLIFHTQHVQRTQIQQNFPTLAPILLTQRTTIHLALTLKKYHPHPYYEIPQPPIHKERL